MFRFKICALEVRAGANGKGLLDMNSNIILRKK